MGGVFQSILVLLIISGFVATNELGQGSASSDTLCDCGQRNFQLQSRIVGGSEADINEYPWIAHLYYKFLGTRYHCGGSIINNYFILTAAHCVDERKWDDILIFLGDHNSKTFEETDFRIHFVEFITMHENYNSRTFENDIALIQTTDEIEFNDIISPICLPEPGQDFSGETATAIGWGQTGLSESSSQVLNEVEVKVLTDRECKSKSRYKITKFPEILCAMGNQKGICLGDSGGPLMVQNIFGDYEQIGVVSFTYGCSSSGYPDGYTRVSEYIDWINRSTSFCTKGRLVD